MKINSGVRTTVTPVAREKRPPPGGRSVHRRGGRLTAVSTVAVVGGRHVDHAGSSAVVGRRLDGCSSRCRSSRSNGSTPGGRGSSRRASVGVERRSRSSSRRSRRTVVGVDHRSSVASAVFVVRRVSSCRSWPPRRWFDGDSSRASRRCSRAADGRLVRASCRGWQWPSRRSRRSCGGCEWRLDGRRLDGGRRRLTANQQPGRSSPDCWLAVAADRRRRLSVCGGVDRQSGCRRRHDQSSPPLGLGVRSNGRCNRTAVRTDRRRRLPDCRGSQRAGTTGSTVSIVSSRRWTTQSKREFYFTQRQRTDER